jgi:hypothetical protein
MKTAGYLTFHEAPGPICEPVTKFGGQPVWLTVPQWPVMPGTGRPMLFLGQVAIDPIFFGPVCGRMAYLFLPAADPLYAVPAHESERNVVVVQPGGSLPAVCEPLTVGPAVCQLARSRRRWLLFRDQIEVLAESQPRLPGGTNLTSIGTRTTTRSHPPRST